MPARSGRSEAKAPKNKKNTMHKITVFTVVLSIVVVAVVAEVLFNNYLGDVEEGKVDVLTTQSSHPSLKKAEGKEPPADSVSLEGDDLQKLIEETDIEAADSVPVKDNTTEELDIDKLLAEEDGNDPEKIDIEVLSIGEAGITDEALQLAKFPDATMVTATFDGNIFQTVDVADLNIEVKKQYVANNDEVFGAVYSFSVDEGMQNELYRIMRERSAFGTTVEINETNTFGDNSYYMNDSKRESTAFLVIRKGVSFYAFAYPKEFNQYFKPLAQSF